MKNKTWVDMRLPDTSDRIWELYHENSKRRTFELELRSGIETPVEEPGIKKSLNVATRAEISLSNLMPLTDNRTADAHTDSALSLNQLAELLLFAYGALQGEEGSSRPIHSEGSHWPVEIYVWHPGNDGVETGLYYFNPEQHTVVLMNDHSTSALQSALEFTDIQTGVVFFITAVFKRSTAYFGERGYRYCCLEAGQVIGNLRSLATEKGYAITTAMEFHDRGVNDFLGIDGVNHATLGVLSIAQKTQL